MIKLAGYTLEVEEIVPSTKARFGESEHANWPESFGVRLTPLGILKSWSLRVFEKTSFEGGSIEAIERIMRLGKSVKLDVEEGSLYRIQTIVYLLSLEAFFIPPTTRRATIGVEEAYRNIATSCDDLEGFEVTSGGGTLSLDSTNMKEGEASVKLGGSIAAGVESALKFTPKHSLKRGTYRWLAFWFRTNNLTDLSNLKIRVYKDDSNYATYTFTSDVTEVDKWYFIRVLLDDFAITGPNFSWDEVSRIEIGETHSSAQTYAFNIDEICFID